MGKSAQGKTAPVLGDGSASFTPGISERRGSTSSFYGADYLGTNSSLYSASETVSATRQYDAFGNLTSSSGSSANPFGFAGNWGYQNDSDSGLKLLGHRYYDASTGRFLTRDPIKDGRNWYAYCGNNPTGAVDPNGLSIVSFWNLALSDYGSDQIADQAELWAFYAEYYKVVFHKDEPWNGSTHNQNNDCGFFAAKCARTADRDIPVRGTGVIFPYLQSSPQWRQVALKDSQPGDILIFPPTGKYGHVAIRSRAGIIEASYGDHGPEHNEFDAGRWSRRGAKAFRVRWTD